MSNKWKFFFLFIVGLLLILLIFGVEGFNKSRGRRMIYPFGSQLTGYPGNGRVTSPFEDRIYIIPKFSQISFSGEGEPFFVDSEDKDKYSVDKYITYDIPAQEQLLYSSGEFYGWEDIMGSEDKYILVKYKTMGEIEKHRLSFQDSGLFGDNATRFAVENVLNFSDSHPENPIEKPEKSKLSEITFAVLNRIIKKGDVIILIPLPDPPELSKRDTEGVLLASWLFIRRSGGLSSLNKEIISLSD